MAGVARFKTKNCTILRPSLTKSTIHLDRIQMQQVIVNLMKNGIEAMTEVPQERRYLDIRSRRDAAGDIEITIVDQGGGTGTEDLEKLFDLYYSTKSNGMGMGLAISRSIVEAHDGELKVSTNADTGLIFQVSLPVKFSAD